MFLFMVEECLSFNEITEEAMYDTAIVIQFEDDESQTNLGISNDILLLIKNKV